MNELLKPCPFCGGEGELCTTPWDFSTNKPKPNHRFVVECSECMASTDDYYCEEAAAEAWNGRVNNG